jgi:P-type E1-E2 ATPase
MGLATPTAIMVGTGRGAELGILFRKGEALQLLKDAKVVALDKTGTLTEGRPALTDVQVTIGFDRNHVLGQIAAASAIAMSSVFVLVNSLRLRAFRSPEVGN